MIILIDPALFHCFSGSKNPDVNEQDDLEKNLEELASILKLTGGSIAAPTGIWNKFYREFVGSAFNKTTRLPIKTAITFLRRRIEEIFIDPKVVATTWGLLSLTTVLAPDHEYWASALSAAAATALRQGRDVLLFTPLLLNRNLIIHKVGNSVLMEKSRWRIYILSRGLVGPTPISCVSSLRNVHVRWTTRYDEYLPDTLPNGKGVAFAPHPHWYLKSTEAFRTIATKPAWVDRSGNGWANPNTPGDAYHWDVHFKSEHESPIGISPVNVVRWGAPISEGVAGSVHHVPAEKRARVKE